MPEDLDRAGEAASTADLLIALGSSLSVYPAASIPLLAVGLGVPYVVINRGPSAHDDLSKDRELQLSVRAESNVRSDLTRAP